MSKKSLTIGTYQIHNDLYPILSESWKRGFHFVDTAPNYRAGNAHLELNQCIEAALSDGLIRSPKAITISTKVGFIPKTQKKFLIEKGIVNEQDTFQFHNLSNKYIRYEIDNIINSFRHTNLETIFLHNPETQLNIRNYDEVLTLVKCGFEILEECVQQGKIKSYGVATWSAFEKNNKGGYFKVHDFLEIAEKVGGSQHHFKVIQFPINLLKLSPLLEYLNESGPLWEATNYNIDVHVSSPLFGGELFKKLPKEIANIIEPGASLSQAALLFSRSHPSVKRLLTSPSTLSQLNDTLFIEGMEDIPLDKLLEITQLLYKENIR